LPWINILAFCAIETKRFGLFF